MKQLIILHDTDFKDRKTFENFVLNSLEIPDEKSKNIVKVEIYIDYIKTDTEY